MKWEIPLIDLSLYHLKYEEEILEEVRNIIKSSEFCSGSRAKLFIENLVAYHGENLYGASCGNGTDAIYLVLKALGIGIGDEVITTSFGVVCDTEAILNAGATPILTDINPTTLLLDENNIESLISKKTKAIVAVNLYGNVVNLHGINKLCKKYDIWLIEDCAQSLGSEYKGNKAGSIGDFSIYSFYPSKNLGAMGDAGAIIGKDENIIKKIRMLGNHGREDRYIHHYSGCNSRLDEIQAAILNIKLKHLENYISSKKAIAEIYNHFLGKISQLTIPKLTVGAKHTYHLYVVMLKRRNELKEYLKNKGIQSEIHYPYCVHQQPGYSNLYKDLQLTNSEYAASNVISLPLYPNIPKAKIEKVISSVYEFHKEQFNRDEFNCFYETCQKEGGNL